MENTFKGLNPWADVMLSHLLIMQLACDVSLKASVAPLRSIDADLPCHEPRLNPLEFHGKRSPSAGHSARVRIF